MVGFTCVVSLKKCDYIGLGRFQRLFPEGHGQHLALTGFLVPNSHVDVGTRGLVIELGVR